jgi:radical SAM superfamily enzyme YgiQ (UPF0313 family)
MMNFSPAIHILSAVLKRAGHETSIIHINENATPYNKNEIIRLCQGYDLFAVTSTSFNYKYANEIAGWLQKSFPEVLIVLGGSHATIQPEDFESSNFDIFCVGEGEEPMLELCDALKNNQAWTNIPNTINRDRVNPVRGFLRDLNSLPFWDFDITDTKKILELRKGWLSISFSRGCAYECTFCINHLYKQIELGPNDKLTDYLRRRDPELAVDELESLVRRFDIKYFNIDDDLLTMYKSWMKKFTDLYRKRIFEPCGIKYVINARADSLTDDICQMLANSGCIEARIGYETGNEQQRNMLLDKKTSDQDLRIAFNKLRKYGILSVAFAMIGLPDESWFTFTDTVRSLVELKPDLIRMTFLYPYKHTKIYDLCVKRNLFKSEDVPDNRDYSSPLKFEYITDKELFCMRFLLAWYLNYHWFYSDDYLEAIELYQKYPLEQLEKSVNDIIEYDKQLSARCKLPHYRYYPNNIDYFELKN